MPGSGRKGFRVRGGTGHRDRPRFEAGLWCPVQELRVSGRSVASVVGRVPSRGAGDRCGVQTDLPHNGREDQSNIKQLRPLFIF